MIGNSTGSTGLGVLGTNYLTGDPILAPLGGYGGSTETLPPLPGSPAIDAAGAGSGADQRGLTRARGAGADIGAVEVTSIVSTNSDSGSGSLREAIEFAVTGSPITFNNSLSGQTITLGTDQLFIGTDLTIDASALDEGVTIDANGDVTNHRVMEIAAGTTATLDSLTITGGEAGGTDGGGVRNNGTLDLFNSTVMDNQSRFGGESTATTTLASPPPIAHWSTTRPTSEVEPMATLGVM